MIIHKKEFCERRVRFYDVAFTNKGAPRLGLAVEEFIELAFNNNGEWEKIGSNEWMYKITTTDKALARVDTVTLVFKLFSIDELPKEQSPNEVIDDVILYRIIYNGKELNWYEREVYVFSIMDKISNLKKNQSIPSSDVNDQKSNKVDSINNNIVVNEEDEKISTENITNCIINVVTNYSKSISCEYKKINPEDIAALVPYQNLESRYDAKYAVIWGGDIGCNGSSGSFSTNIAVVRIGVGYIFLVDPSLSSPVVKFDIPFKSAEKIIGNTENSIIIEGLALGPDDPNCCPSVKTQVTVKVDEDGNWKLVNQHAVKIISWLKHNYPLGNISNKRAGWRRMPTQKFKFSDG